MTSYIVILYHGYSVLVMFIVCLEPLQFQSPKYLDKHGIPLSRKEFRFHLSWMYLQKDPPRLLRKIKLTNQTYGNYCMCCNSTTVADMGNTEILSVLLKMQIIGLIGGLSFNIHRRHVPILMCLANKQNFNGHKPEVSNHY